MHRPLPDRLSVALSCLFSLLESGGYGACIRVFLKPNPFAIAEAVNIDNRNLERGSAGFAPTPVFAQDDHLISIVHHMLSDCREFLVVCWDNAKEFAGNALRSPANAAKGIVRCLGNVPHDVQGPLPPEWQGYHPVRTLRTNVGPG